MFPFTSEGLIFSYHSAWPQKASFIFTHYFNLYLTKMITFPFDNLLRGYALASLLYHVGIIIFAYLIARRLAGKIQGLLAAILTAICPFFLVWATQYFSDAPCLFFGLGALYFSLMDNAYSKIHIKYFIVGFLLTASLFSNPFGVAFIIPVLFNLWTAQFWKNIIFFLLGISGVMLFIAFNDYIWLGDFFYHLDPGYYLVCKNDIAFKLARVFEGSTGRPQSLITLLTDNMFIPYLIFFITFSFQGFSFLVDKESFDWKKRGSFSLAIGGLSLAIFFSIVSLAHRGWWERPHYNYCIFVPWGIAFCSILRFFKEREPKKKWIDKPDIIAGCLSIVFLIVLFTTRYASFDLSRPSLGRFFSLVSLWIIVISTILVLAAGNYLSRIGYKKIIVFIFLTGCFGIIWNNANGATQFSADSKKINLFLQTRLFLEKYQELSQKARIVPVNCDGGRGYELEITLLLAKLIDRKNLNYFDRKDKLPEVLNSVPLPFYLMTKYDAKFLAHEADAVGFRIIPVADGTYFDCSFYLIVRSDEAEKKNKP